MGQATKAVINSTRRLEFSLTPAAVKTRASTAALCRDGSPAKASSRALLSSAPVQPHPSESAPASHTAWALLDSHLETNRCCAASILRENSLATLQFSKQSR